MIQPETQPEVIALHTLERLKEIVEGAVGRQFSRSQFWRYRKTLRIKQPPYTDGDAQALIKFVEFVGYGQQMATAKRSTRKYFEQLQEVSHG